MWIRKTNREGLLDIFGGNIGALSEGYNSDAFPAEAVHGDDLYVVWDSSPEGKDNLPSLIVVAEGHERDFVAWVSTYLVNYRPFTAYFRVVSTNEIHSMESLNESPSLSGIESPCVGLIIGETLTLASDLTSPTSLSVVSCLSTYSFCMLRALALGISSEELGVIGRKWGLARNLTGQPSRNLSVTTIEDIVRMMASFRNIDNTGRGPEIDQRIPPAIVMACKQLMEEGMVSGTTWSELTEGAKDLEAVKERMEAPREERVRFFQSVVSRLATMRERGSLNRAFISGYLASLIAPGSMSHVNLVTDYVRQMPLVLVWYGLCAGLHKKNDVLSSFNVLGRRVLRELLRPESMLSRPSTDISVSELQVLLEGNGRSAKFRTFSSNHLVVELAPLVSTYLSMTKQVDSRQLSLFGSEEQPQIPTKLLNKLGSLLKQAMQVHEVITEESGPSSPKESKSKKRTKKE